MYQRGIRGAITIESNTIEALREGVKELFSSIKNKNNIKESDISHVIFTMTDDLDCIYPAQIAREEFEEFKTVPMVCLSEMKIKNSLNKCLRILIVINTNLSQNEIKHVYLKGAEILRKDINK